MNPQMYQGPNQRRPSNFMPQTPTANYQASPAPVPYSAAQPVQYGAYPTNRVPPTAAAPIYNPNAPRPIEVYHLNDAANGAIPADIRSQFHCDAQGHVLFFSVPPLDLIPPAEQKLSHSLKYLASKEERAKKVAERKRKLAEEQREREEAAKRQRADEETALAARIEALTPKAIESMVQQVVSGTDKFYKSLYGDQAESVRAADEKVRESRIQADRANGQLIAQILAQTKDGGFVSLKGSAMYLGDI
jgi:chromatin structure-remodeling complex subunit RSC1/2